MDIDDLVGQAWTADFSITKRKVDLQALSVDVPLSNREMQRHFSTLEIYTVGCGGQGTNRISQD